MDLLRTWVVALVVVGCGSERSAGRVAGPYGTADELIAAAEARIEALCDCSTPACRTQVMSAPDNPFGAAAVGPRARFTPAQRVRYAELMKQSFACATGQ
jgi:hypothetical protein